MEIRFRRGSIHLDRCAPPGGSAALMFGSIDGADGADGLLICRAGWLLCGVLSREIYR